MTIALPDIPLIEIGRITAERPANIKTIEHYLLLAGDLPGVASAHSVVASIAAQAAELMTEPLPETDEGSISSRAVPVTVAPAARY